MKRTAKSTKQRSAKTVSPKPKPKPNKPTRDRTATMGKENNLRAAAAGGGEARDPSDLARDQRLRDDLEYDGARSPLDRHRERLTATEAEEDGVREDDDDERDESQKREQALTEQDIDDERS